MLNSKDKLHKTKEVHPAIKAVIVKEDSLQDQLLEVHHTSILQLL
jgi:hypothetical protein